MLSESWRDVDAARMASALSVFDPTYSGYLDWRALLLALAAATFSPLHTATPAQMAAQALQLAAADGDSDGKLTRQEFEGLRWWFEPRAELQEAAAASPEQHADVLQELARCGGKGLHLIIQFTVCWPQQTSFAATKHARMHVDITWLVGV